MPFVLLFVLGIACLPASWPQPLAWLGQDGNPALFCAFTWLAVLGSVLLAAGISRRICKELHGAPHARENILHRYSRWRRRHVYFLYALFELEVYVFGWGWTVRSLCTPAAPIGPFPATLLPGAEFLTLAPLLISLVLTWLFFYNVERAIQETACPYCEGHSSFWSRGEYVRFHLRQNLALIAAPILLLIVLKGLHRLFADAEFLVAASLGLPIALFVFLPWILRLTLGLRPLPAGPLRCRLEAMARRLNFRCSDILLWNTHGDVANAMVAGILPWVRYVLLSDRLIHELTPEEIEAVFGHEIGHVKHRHMFYYMCFLFVSLSVVTGLWSVAKSQWQPVPHAMLSFSAQTGVARTSQAWNASEEESYEEVLPLIMIVGAYIFVVFGFLSRRCERQADVYGCRAVSCARTDCAGHGQEDLPAPNGLGLCPTGILIFIDALEKVAFINGISRHRPGWLQSWQHSTIARRVEFLQRVLHDPSVEPRFQRTVGMVKWGLLIVLGAMYWMLHALQG